MPPLPPRSHWTTYEYDAFGRTKRVTLPDGNSKTEYAYVGNAVTTTDPALKWKTFTQDAVGNLTKVTEPNPAGGTWDTNYTYYAAGQLKQVQMTRGANTQTRTFNINVSTGLLTSTTNPETGTVQYFYASGRLSHTIDAKGQKLERIYDSYGRVTELRKYPNGVTEDTTQRVTYYHDVNPFNGSYTQNGWGRVAAVSYARKYPNQIHDIGFVEQYSYTQAGLPTKKLWTMVNTNSGSLEALYSYDNEGRRTAMTAPGAYNADGVTWEAGKVFNYQYDTMGRPSGMTQPATGTTWVSGITYNVAGQVTAMNFLGNGESRGYNILGQMTTLVSGSVNLEYRFHASQNNGRITSMKDNVSGEEVNYTYDSLNRLLTAATTGPDWGLSFAYDGFGNKTGQTVTKGTGPALNIGADPATNRVGSTDANGNQLTGGSCTAGDCYDVVNRMVFPNGAPVGIGYAPDNKRIWERRNLGDEVYQERVMFYGADGMRQGVYKVVAGNPLRFAKITESVYFGSKLIWQNGEMIVTDRLGSVVQPGSTRLTYYPYGEEKPGATSQDKEKFGTYYRDSLTGLDYADQRHFSHQWGRFTSPDPYKASAGAGEPGSWNRYAYVENDPVNLVDPTGEIAACPAGTVTGPSGKSCVRPGDPFASMIATAMAKNQAATSLFAFPPGDVQTMEDYWEAHAQWQTMTFRKRALDGLDQLSQNCKDLFSGLYLSEFGVGTDLMSALVDAAGTTQFRSTWGGQGELSINRIVGSNIDPKNRSVHEYVNDPANGLVGTVALAYTGYGNAVVFINPEFYNYASDSQDLTLVHEILHVVTRQKDRELADLFGLRIGDPSIAIQYWLERGCK